MVKIIPIEKQYSKFLMFNDWPIMEVEKETYTNPYLGACDPYIFFKTCFRNSSWQTNPNRPPVQTAKPRPYLVNIVQIMPNHLNGSTCQKPELYVLYL